MLTRPLDEINNKAIELFNLINEQKIDKRLLITVEDSFSEVGGGSLPLERLASKCLTIYSNDYSIETIESILRNHRTPIITRIYKDKIHLDLRTIKRDEFQTIVEALLGMKTIL